ncbi:hypothetical protein L386_02884 [Klebsiella variicola]|nr:hypothetical protein L386_02884 [Klebsiella variicola]
MLAGEKLQADIAAVLVESVDAVHLLNHVEDVDFYLSLRGIAIGQGSLIAVNR